MKLNGIDIAVLNALLQDGRASLRDIARKTSLTTPTVSYHYSRMVKSGLIKKFTPILDQGMVGKGINAFVMLRTKAGDTSNVSKKLLSIGQVSALFVTSGENNILLRVNCADMRELQELLNVTLPKLVEGEVVSSQLIVDTVKDEQPVTLSSDIAVSLKCDLCKGEIASERPYNIRVGSTYHYFCCRTCRKSYIEKYGKRMKRINAQRTA
jgi:Lrp/AsnC family transcriptional regulator for asnA, asnC and gidA